MIAPDLKTEWGFSKLDTMFGNDLAGKQRLTPLQAAAAMKMIRKSEKTELSITGSITGLPGTR
jgi:hypothetical protein